mgnify:CR=1 FL=1
MLRVPASVSHQLVQTQQSDHAAAARIQISIAVCHCCCPAAADALARGAKALEEKSPAEASALYLEAIEQYENDGKESQVMLQACFA